MPDLQIAPAEYDKLATYVDLASTEIAAFGYCTERDDHFYVDDVFLVPQEVSGTAVEFMEDGLPWAVKKAAKDNRLDDLRFCAHSHVNMGAFWSQDDAEMIEKMGETGTPWFISLVLNKEGKNAARLDYFDLPTEVIDHLHMELTLVREPEEEDTKLIEACTKEIEKHVSKLKPSSNWTKGNGKNSTTYTAPKDNSRDDAVSKKVKKALGQATDDELLEEIYDRQLEQEVVETVGNSYADLEGMSWGDFDKLSRDDQERLLAGGWNIS